MPAKARLTTRRKDKKNIPLGQAHIKSTFNNTIVSITDPTGAVISQASSGQVGFKGSRKSTPYAAQLAAESAARRAQEHGVKKVDVFVKGPGSGRETAIRSLQAAGLEVGSIQDVTPQAQMLRPPASPCLRRSNAPELAASSSKNSENSQDPRVDLGPQVGSTAQRHIKDAGGKERRATASAPF